MSLGGWSINQEFFDKIKEYVPEGSTILELGSGYGTQQLSKYYKMCSIENDGVFVGRYDSNYIYAPMKGYWYDVDIVKNNLPEKYDAILIDGPIGTISRNRIGFWENRDLFDLKVWLFFDDTNRRERDMFRLFMELFPKRKVEIFNVFSIMHPIEE